MIYEACLLFDEIFEKFNQYRYNPYNLQYFAAVEDF